MGDTDEANNQRVTNALIKRDLDHLTEMGRDFRDEIRTCNDDHDGRIRALEGNQRSILTLIENLDSRVKTWNITNSVGVVIAGVLAALGIRQ